MAIYYFFFPSSVSEIISDRRKCIPEDRNFICISIIGGISPEDNRKGIVPRKQVINRKCYTICIPVISYYIPMDRKGCIQPAIVRDSIAVSHGVIREIIMIVIVIGNRCSNRTAGTVRVIKREV